VNGYYCPARYARFVEARLVEAIKEAFRDASYRSDEVTANFASVDDDLIDEQEAGLALILIGPVDRPIVAVPELPPPLLRGESVSELPYPTVRGEAPPPDGSEDTELYM
jgi:hypothetical protein